MQALPLQIPFGFFPSWLAGMRFISPTSSSGFEGQQAASQPYFIPSFKIQGAG
jgi:hypothetical protein